MRYFFTGSIRSPWTIPCLRMEYTAHLLAGLQILASPGTMNYQWLLVPDLAIN
jgi:hypothetical protein